MAQQDHNVSDNEAELMERIMTASNIQPYEVGEFSDPIDENVEELALQLKTRLAKRAFLLAMATVAQADGEVGPEERQWFNELAQLLNVGTIDLEHLTFDKAEAMVIKLLEERKDAPASSGHGLDMDML